MKWIPAWGHDRIYNMIANRPDWCISRQRAWGVPIPAVDCVACGEAIVTTALVEQTARIFEQYGADAWYERPTAEFIPPGLTCPACGGSAFEREMNILDVWFDSGSSHEAVLSVRPDLTWPADIYLEGSDQHRGWFQSSMLVGLGTRGRPPYREVVTHGFIVAEDGRKMSKSLGNSIEPADIIKQSGADILRLWVSMADYTQEVHLSKEILARVVEAYRKIRNTLRYLLGNLYDFDPAVDAVETGRLEEVDRYILARYAEVGQRILKAYDEYEYGTIFQAANAFATLDLSAFYADVSKDRLYTFAAGSPERKSAQTAMYLMADGLTRLIAPILSFTADELWRFLPSHREESVHIAVFPSPAELDAFADPALVDRWARLIAVREQVLAEIEPLRKDKRIGSSLQARVVLSADGGGSDTAPPVRSPPADVVHRVRRGAAATVGHRGGNRSHRRGAADPRYDRAGGRRAVRAMLALRRKNLDRSGVRRALRPLPGRPCRLNGRHPQPEPPMTEASNEAVLAAEATRAESSAQAAPWRLRRLDIWLPVVIVVLDQITKFFVRANVPLYSTVTVIPGFMNITHVLNTGAAFGILNSSDFPFKTVVIAVIATAALIGVGMYAASLGHHQLLARVGLALILGGAAGNLIDRITAGSVVDFVDVVLGDVSFLGVQRRGFGDFRRRHGHDSRHAGGWHACIQDCLSWGRSPSTPTGSCSPRRTCSA